VLSNGDPARCCAMSSKSFILFEDLVEVKSVDTKHFAKVGRITAKAENYDLEFKIDVNTAIYHLAEGEKLNLAIASSLSLEYKPDEGIYDQSRDKSTLVDEYDYVAYGKVFKYDDDGAKVTACVSFGGLLMSVTGNAKHLTGMEMDSRLYLLLRKVNN